ncbi:MAG: hypothetical protein JZU65_06820, partial [Chlorobium sp.]|nr:hypothetical protein [Chlorobium sp.]
NNKFNGPITVAANNIKVAATDDLNFASANARGNFTTTASNSLIFNDVTVGGNLIATSLHGDIARNGTFLVAGAVTLLAPGSTIGGFVTKQILDISRISFAPETLIPTDSNPALVIVSNPADAGGTISTLDGSTLSSSDGRQTTVRFAEKGAKPLGNTGTTSSATISVVILKAGTQPDTAGYFTLIEVEGAYVMSPIDRPAGNKIDAPGKSLNQIEIILVDDRSSNAVFRLELVDNGLVIKPVGKLAEEMVKNKRNQVIGMAFAELRKQPNVSIKAIQTVFIIL